MESAQLTVADKAIEILRQTRDGDTLEPRDLKLVEMAVNDFLNEDGKQAFETLFRSCLYSTAGTSHLLLDSTSSRTPSRLAITPIIPLGTFADHAPNAAMTIHVPPACTSFSLSMI